METPAAAAGKKKQAKIRATRPAAILSFSASMSVGHLRLWVQLGQPLVFAKRKGHVSAMAFVRQCLYLIWFHLNSSKVKLIFLSTLSQKGGTSSLRYT